MCYASYMRFSIRPSLCLCVSVRYTQHLTSQMFVRLTNDTTYLTGSGKEIYTYILFTEEDDENEE